MTRASKIVPCVDCQEMYPRKQLNRMGRCHGCAGKATGEAAYQLSQHQGPYYDKWKQGIQNAIRRL